MSGFRPLFGKPPKRIKKMGYSFASRLESTLHDELILWEKGGIIKDIKLQPHVHLTRAKVLMIPDFSAYDVELGQTVYFEAKGFETDVWRIKRRLWTVYGPGRLRVFKGSGKIKMVEELIPTGEGE